MLKIGSSYPLGTKVSGCSIKRRLLILFSPGPFLLVYELDFRSQFEQVLANTLHE